MSASFDDSRRLTGPSLYFSGTGAVLETAIGVVDDALVDGWRERIGRARRHLQWPDQALTIRRHASGVSLAFEAPPDQLYAATEVNEWAWLSTLHEQARHGFDRYHGPGHPAVDDEAAALSLLNRIASEEAQPRLAPLLEAAAAHGLQALVDDDVLSLGTGHGSHSWPVDELPDPDQVPWSTLHDIPFALVTGSNGKTTTVRLLAAIAAAHGWRTAHSCTDGLYVGATLLEGGDYSGPAGARSLLRRTDVDAAILETARGGMLRRGLAVTRAPVAVVTNVSPDHYGEYGIHDLAGLAEVKLTVAKVVPPDGVLVLNADDALLRARADSLDCPLAWFASDDEQPLLVAARAAQLRTCAPQDGRLWLFDGHQRHDLGAIAAMPLALGGSATYNLANAAAAALAASALGIAATTIAEVLARFGRHHQDNPGRLQHWRLGEVEVYLDYAHNPEGLAGLLQVATRNREGRLGLILGQAGNRGDAEIRDLAAVAADHRPDHVLLKDMDGYLRGRAAGEVAAILREALRAHGIPDAALVECLDETEAARAMLAWARAGDTLVLPIHNAEARIRVNTLLDHLQTSDWHPGQPLPPEPATTPAV